MKYRILHLCPSFDNPLYSEIVKRQMANNEWIRVFYFRGKREGLPNSDREYVDGVMPYNELDRFFFMIKERKLISAFKSIYMKGQFDLIQAHTLFVSGYLARTIKKQWGIPYVVAVRGTDVNVFFKYRINLREIGVRILEDADKIIFITKIHMNQVFDKYIPVAKRDMIRDKTVVISNGIHDFWLDRIADRKAKPADRAVNLIYYGDINKNKNVRLTIKAAKKMILEGYKIKFKIIGRIQDYREKKYITSNEFVEYYDFMPKEELIEFLKKSDIFCMPSHSETFGLSYIEAMTQGLPVIYTRGQGIDGMFDEGVVGYHVNPKSVDDMAEKIRLILSDYEVISNNCRALSAKFNWDYIVNEYQDLYAGILDTNL